MVYQKIKKSETSMGSIIFSLLILMGIFFGGFYWISSNAIESGRTIDPVYNTSFVQLQQQETNLSNTITTIRNSATNVTEAGTDFGVALNGLKGLLSVFRAMFQVVDMGWQSTQLVLAPITNLMPIWLLTLIEIGIIAVIILIIIAIFKGDGGKLI